jgi:hypothetical protein
MQKMSQQEGKLRGEVVKSIKEEKGVEGELEDKIVEQATGRLEEVLDILVKSNSVFDLGGRLKGETEEQQQTAAIQQMKQRQTAAM